MPGRQLDIDVKQDGDAYVVALAGAIDASSTEDIRQAVEPLVNQPKAKVILDCTALNYVNSTGYGLFFAWQRTCASHGGRFVLCGVRPKLQNLMKLLGLEKYVTFCAHIEEARTALSKG